jgi:lipoprotein-releasing system permease protein
LISQLEKEIIFRFLKARKKDGFLNVISIFSFIGIGLGVAVLIIVMSVMNGFRTELINKIVGFNAHAVVKPYNKPLIHIPDIDFAKGIVSNDGEAVILSKLNTKGVLLKGYLKNDFKNLEILNNQKYFGSKDLQNNSISIGKDLSFLLNIDIGDQITIMSPSGVQTIVGSFPRQDKFEVISIFDSGIGEFNENVAYINLNTLEDFFDKNKDNRFTEYYFKDPKNIESYKKNLLVLFPDAYVYTWADLNESLFSALKVERNVMFIILSLIIIVAAFNIISGLTILVKNKTRDIGTLFGILLGTLFSYYIEDIRKFISNTFDITLFPEEIYFLSTLPSEINVNSIILITLCSIITTSAVSIYPASRAAKLDTIQTLKYE